MKWFVRTVLPRLLMALTVVVALAVAATAVAGTGFS
jgi:hypothetical protein